MLALKLKDTLRREHHCRVAIGRLFHASPIPVRVGTTREFMLFVPLPRPEKRAAVLRQFQREMPDYEFELVEVLDLDGPRYRPVQEHEVDERGKFIGAASSTAGAPTGRPATVMTKQNTSPLDVLPTAERMNAERQHALEARKAERRSAPAAGDDWLEGGQ